MTDYPDRIDGDTQDSAQYWPLLCNQLGARGPANQEAPRPVGIQLGTATVQPGPMMPAPAEPSEYSTALMAALKTEMAQLKAHNAHLTETIRRQSLHHCDLVQQFEAMRVELAALTAANARLLGLLTPGPLKAEPKPDATFPTNALRYSL